MPSARHDTLGSILDKMLTLTPKLREETDEKKRADLQNAVDATDRKIDGLDYELYGLSKEEIELVEEGSAGTPARNS